MTPDNILCMMRRINDGFAEKIKNAGGEPSQLPRLTLVTDGATGKLFFIGEELMDIDHCSVSGLEQLVEKQLSEVLSAMVYLAEDYLDEEFIKYPEISRAKDKNVDDIRLRSVRIIYRDD